MALLDRAIVRVLPAVPRPVVRRLSDRYIAGPELDDALAVVRTLNEEWGGMHRWLETADGSNPYLARIQRNVSRAMAMARALQGVAPISSRGPNLG